MTYDDTCPVTLGGCWGAMLHCLQLVTSIEGQNNVANSVSLCPHKMYYPFYPWTGNMAQ